MSAPEVAEDGRTPLTEMSMRREEDGHRCEWCGAYLGVDGGLAPILNPRLRFCDEGHYDIWIEQRPGVEQRPGDPRFHEILDEMRALHEKKGTDYGDAAKGDFLANVRVAEQWGVPPWLGVMIRATDKVTRLQSYAKTGHLANEGAEDSLMDLAAYSIIALILLREEDQ